MERLKILQCCGPTHVEQIASRAKVTSAPALSACNVSKPVLDRHALAQAGAAALRSDLFTKSVLQLLVVGDAHRATDTGRGHRALVAKRASRACLGIELHDRPRAARF